MLYDSVTNVAQESMYHTFQSNSKDWNEVIEELKKAKVFDVVINRELAYFADMEGSIMDKVEMNTLKEWMTTQLNPLFSLIQYIKKVFA